MKVGLFMMPTHLPGSDPYEAAQWDLQVLRWADELGFSEAWIGEHFTVPFEPVPAPDLLIAQALCQTKQIKLASGVHLLPYHHPAELAHRIAYLDHLAQGRYMVGIGAGALPGDVALFGTEGTNQDLMREALEIMLQIWRSAAEGGEEPFEFDGHWKGRYGGPDGFHAIHLAPYQSPHPPIGMAGGSPRSATMRFAGEQGFMPLSFNLPPARLRMQWETYSDAAAAAGRDADRAQWRVYREFFVAETDEEAMRWSVGDMFGRVEREFLLETHASLGQLTALAPDPDIAEADVTPEYLAEHAWLVGSPDTVARKLRQQYEEAGGWGTLLLQTFDYSHAPEPWRNSMELMMNEVMPQVADLDLEPSSVGGK